MYTATRYLHSILGRTTALGYIQHEAAHDLLKAQWIYDYAYSGGVAPNGKA